MAQSSPPIVTLTTDFGQGDFHLPRLKAHLLGSGRAIQLVDLTHDIPPYDIVRASFIFKRVWQHYPAGTIHVVSVNDFYQPKSRFLAILHERQYFIGPDNGIFSLIFGKLPEETYVLDGLKSSTSLPEIYARAVAHVAADKPFYEVGLPTTKFTERLTFQPVIGPDYIRGTVSFVDRYDNVTTNVTRGRFEEIGRGRPFQLLIKRMKPLDQLSVRYHDVPQGEALCRFNSDGYLEVAINMGRAASLLSIQEEDMVQVEFRE
ncbi:SAM hydrolase/SAM-dependent halogenase family protein [Neolewinella antarctica]|uniref:Adenosyl-chloride synthase n=1 Tax=Neolewinella antarctica TaxID=442734 RepID=A0ABX0XEH4_9BACT|nr:SAM-dependent chlorinase/fluorinase [Neolewinella antarctica]NJC27715.1 hypothetical protein [Neolewinella antarctica]